MKFIYGLKQINDLPNRFVATIGNFDGVHCGHQALLASLCEQSKRFNAPSLVILFEPQPSEYFKGNGSPSRLMTLREKLFALKTMQVDYVCCLKFNAKLAQMSAEAFAQQILFKSLRIIYLLTGSDFRFGCDRKGDVELLKRLGKTHHCDVQSFPNYTLDNTRISSTGIRRALQEGHLEIARLGLGKYYSILGRVIVGQGRGRQWGIPTANVLLKHQRVPLLGVFKVIVKWRDQQWCGVANMGYRPTIEGSEHLSLEVHLFDFNQSLYGEMIQVFFVRKLRNEKKFASVQALIEQIRLDIKAAREETHLGAVDN